MGNLPLLELGLECLEHSLALLGGLNSLLGDDVLEVEILLDGESSGQQVSVVDELHERLDLSLALNFLVGHSLGNLLGGPLDTSNESVSELSVLLAFVDLLDDDSLLTGVSASEQDHDATLLHTKRIRWVKIECLSPDMQISLLLPR